MAATLSDGFCDITKALDTIAERIDFVVDRDVLGDALLDAVALGHRVDALTARLGLAATLNGVAAEHGQRTIGQFVAARTNSPSLDVNRLTTNAKWLRDFPTLEAAFGNELTNNHIDYLRKKLDTNFDTHVNLLGDQQFFVDTAATCSFKGFTVACDYWLVTIDPDGKEPQDQIDNARFSVRNGRGGRGEISGMCDAVTAQDIRTAVDREAEKLRQADKHDGIDRTNSQRNMAALAALVARGAARDAAGSPVRRLGGIVMSLNVAEWALNQLASNADSADTDPTTTVPVHPSDVDGRCELLDGTPIHPFLAVTALGLATPHGVTNPATLRRYVMQADSWLLDVSVDARFFPEWMKTAALVQSRGQCEVHGCDNPHSWMQTDHVHPVAHGGQTRFDQAQTNCRPDNHAKGATPNQTPWRDRTPPERRQHRSQRKPGADDDDGDERS